MRLLAILALLLLPRQDEKAIDALIAALDADTPDERELAVKGLLEIGERALPRLKQAAGRMSGEPRVRLGEAVREIEARVEEEALAKAGLPPRLAREIPRLRERFFSADEAVVLDALKEVFGYRKDRDSEEERWMYARPQMDGDEMGPALRSVLERAKDPALKFAALTLAGTHSQRGLRDQFLRMVEDPDPHVRRAVRRWAGRIPLAGAEEAFGRIVREGTDDQKLEALQALRQMGTGKAGREMMAALGDPSRIIRANAAQELARVEQEAAVPAIRRLLKDPEGHVRSAAVHALQNLQAFEALGDILALENDPELNVRIAVVLAAGYWNDPRGKDLILRALGKEEDTRILLYAIRGSASLRWGEARPKLIRILKGADGELADEAARALETIGPGPCEADLLELVRGTDDPVRCRAIQALSGSPSRPAVGLFVKALSDPDLPVRQAAAAGLGKARGPEILPALREALKVKDSAFRVAILEGLAESREPGAGRPALGFLDDPEAEVVAAAIRVVNRQRVAEAVPRLEKLLEHPSREVASEAVSAIDRVAGPRGFPVMLRALDKVSPETQRRIWYSIVQEPDEALVEATIERMERLSADSRYYALRMVASYPCAKSTAFLVKLLGNKEAAGRDSAIEVLVRRGNAEGLKAAKEDLRSLERGTRVAAAEVLVEIGEGGEEAVKVLLDGLRCVNERFARGCLRPLAERLRPEARPFLLAALRDREAHNREEVAQWMAGYPRGTFDTEVRAFAGDPDESVRWGAAKALAHVETPDRVELLRKLLEDPVTSVRVQAVMAFETVKPGAVPRELEARLSDPSDQVRRCAVRAVGKLNSAIIKSRTEALFADRIPSIRERAAWAVGEGKVDVPAGSLEKLLDDPDPEVRSSAARAIGLLGRRGSAETLVRKWEDDPAPRVRGAAAHALLEMGHERGVEAVRSLVECGPSLDDGLGETALVERRDRATVPAALAFVARSTHTDGDANRTLFAMNVFTQPELYRKAKESRIDLRGWKGSEREWIAKLGEAMGLPCEVDPGVPEFTMAARRREGLERPLVDEWMSLGYYLNAAAILEPGRIRVVPRVDALAHWERWQGR